MLESFEALQKRRPSMDSDQERRHLAQADRHIAEAKKHILRQRVIVQKAIKKGRPSPDAEAMLKILMAHLHAFEKHRQLILRLLANAKK
jgi:hypothetical protein